MDDRGNNRRGRSAVAVARMRDGGPRKSLPEAFLAYSSIAEKRGRRTSEPVVVESLNDSDLQPSRRDMPRAKSAGACCESARRLAVQCDRATECRCKQNRSRLPGQPTAVCQIAPMVSLCTNNGIPHSRAPRAAPPPIRTSFASGPLKIVMNGQYSHTRSRGLPDSGSAVRHDVRSIPAADY